MFDIFAKLLSSLTSILLPLFASYKALRTNSPSHLAPWLMYWSVLSLFTLLESWFLFILSWIPFYAYLRLLFLLYLVLPQTQGAKVIYLQHVEPWLRENESAIEDAIGRVHARMKEMGMGYLKKAVEVLRTQVLGLPPGEDRPAAAAAAAVPVVPSHQQQQQSYTQALLARFSLPGLPTGGATGQGTGVADFYNLLAGAVAAATSGSSSGAEASPVRSFGPESGPGGMGASGFLIPEYVQGTEEKVSFLAAQRERLGVLLAVMDREAAQLAGEERKERVGSGSLDGPAAEKIGVPLAKSRSEADFEKLEAESGEEEDVGSGSGVRRRTPGTGGQPAGWVSWAWGGGGGDGGKSSGVEK